MCSCISVHAYCIQNHMNFAHGIIIDMTLKRKRILEEMKIH